MQKLLKLFNPVYKHLVTAILIAIPLFPKFPAIDISGTYVSIRLEDFLIFVTLMLFLVPILLNIKQIFKDKVSRSIMLFVLIGLVSLISGIFLTQTVPLRIGLLHWVRRIEYLSLFFIGFAYIKSLYENYETKYNFFNYLINILLLVNLFVFIYGVGQHYLNFPVIVTQNEEYSKGIALRWVPGAHINSTFAGHYDLASYMVLTIPVFVTLFFVIKEKYAKLILGLSVAAGFWLLSAAVSRISIVAFMVASGVSLLLLKKYKEIIVIFAISTLVFAFSPDLQVRYKRIFDVVIQKISSVLVVQAQENGNVNEDRSTSIRLAVEWPRAMRAFYKNPILGTGYSSITLATDNDYLRALGETGFLGLSSFLLIFVAIYKTVKAYRFDDSLESVFIASYIGSTVGIMITAIFIDIFEASKFATIYWLFTGFVVGTMLNKRLSNRNNK